jgi:hypothetical protein
LSRPTSTIYGRERALRWRRRRGRILLEMVVFGPTHWRRFLYFRCAPPCSCRGLGPGRAGACWVGLRARGRAVLGGAGPGPRDNERTKKQDERSKIQQNDPVRRLCAYASARCLPVPPFSADTPALRPRAVLHLPSFFFVSPSPPPSTSPSPVQPLHPRATSSDASSPTSSTAPLCSSEKKGGLWPAPRLANGPSSPPVY